MWGKLEKLLRWNAHHFYGGTNTHTHTHNIAANRKMKRAKDIEMNFGVARILGRESEERD